MKPVSPPLTVSHVEYLLSNPPVAADDRLLPLLAPFPQTIFTGPEEISSNYNWPVPHILPSVDFEVSAQLAQDYPIQPPPDNVSTTPISNYQTPVDYSRSHHLDT
jgi:hypothetical protein